MNHFFTWARVRYALVALLMLTLSGVTIAPMASAQGGTPARSVSDPENNSGLPDPIQRDRCERDYDEFEFVPSPGDEDRYYMDWATMSEVTPGQPYSTNGRDSVELRVYTRSYVMLASWTLGYTNDTPCATEQSPHTATVKLGRGYGAMFSEREASATLYNTAEPEGVEPQSIPNGAYAVAYDETGNSVSASEHITQPIRDGEFVTLEWTAGLGHSALLPGKWDIYFYLNQDVNQKFYAGTVLVPEKTGPRRQPRPHAKVKVRPGGKSKTVLKTGSTAGTVKVLIKRRGAKSRNLRVIKRHVGPDTRRVIRVGTRVPCRGMVVVKWEDLNKPLAKQRHPRRRC